VAHEARVWDDVNPASCECIIDYLLTATFLGTFNIKTGEASGTLTFTGGTGAWALAEGTGTFTAEIDVGSTTHQKMTLDLVGGIQRGPGL
jgi:hypothetical protein